MTESLHESNIHSRKLYCTFFFSPETLALFSLLKEGNPSPDRKMIKLLTFDNFFSATTTFSLNVAVE